MKNAEDELVSIGFRKNREEPAFWHAVRLEAPAFSARPAGAGQEPAGSRTLARWREILARGPVAPAYRISRAGG
jgi:hypothetical protein